MAAPCEPEGRGMTAAVLCLILLLLLAGVLVFLLWRYSHVHSRLRATHRRPGRLRLVRRHKTIRRFFPEVSD